MERRGGVRESDGGLLLYNPVFFFSCTIERTLRFANNEESEGKEVWCRSDNNQSLRVYIERLGLFNVLLASHHNFLVRAPPNLNSSTYPPAHLHL